MDEPRESIWSVPSSLKTIYYAMFTVFASLSAALALVDVLSPGSPGSIVDRVLRFGERLAPMAVASAALSMLAMEVAGMIGVVASYLQRRRDERLLERGRAEGRAEERAKWEERERRKADSGKPAPPPSADGDAGT